MEIMKTVVPVALLLITTCLAVENATTKSVQLNVQKREKQYLIEDDPNEGPEQKRDERQSTPAKNNRNLDPKGNSRIINIRMQPTPNILTTPKQVIKPGPQRIPTKIPVILKTAKVVPGPAHALRMKMLENRINETRCDASKENTTRPNIAPPMVPKDSLPYFTIEDKTARRSESSSSSTNVDDEKPDLGSNETLNRDGKETSGNDRVNSQNKDNNASQNEGKNHQVVSNSERKTTVQKPVHFFVDEPEPLPPSFRRQQKYENTASLGLEVTPSKVKEMPIGKKSNIKPKTIETRRKSNENDDDNDPDIVKISNGTHLISIKKIKNHDGDKNARDGYEITVPTEERIINQPPPKPKLEKPADEPEKLSFTVTEKSNGGRHHNPDLTGLAFRDSKNKEENGQNNCEEIEEKTQIVTPITLQPISPPTVINQGNQESWNYLQNPYYNPYYQNIYDQYRKNYGLVQSNPNIYGQDVIDPRSYGTQINPWIYGQAPIEPYIPEVSTLFAESTQYPYPHTHENQPKIDIPCPLRQDIRTENTLENVWNNRQDIEVKTRNAPNNDNDVLDIDIRRDLDGNIDGAKVETRIGKVASPYAASSLPININVPFAFQGYGASFEQSPQPQQALAGPVFYADSYSSQPGSGSDQTASHPMHAILRPAQAPTEAENRPATPDARGIFFCCADVSSLRNMAER